MAPWITWQTYRRLTLPWARAKAARVDFSALSTAVTVRLVERSDLERFAEDPVYEFSARLLEALYSRNDPCVGAFSAGTLVCYGFFSAAPTDIDEDLRFHFPPSWLYVYKGFTHPAWRGRRLRPFVLLNAIPLLQEWLGPVHEPDGLVTLVLSDNYSSLKALGRIGFEPQGEFRILRIANRPRLIAERRCPQSDFFIDAIS